MLEKEVALPDEDNVGLGHRWHFFALYATDGSQYRQVPTAIAGAGLALAGGVLAWIVKLAHLSQREDRG